MKFKIGDPVQFKTKSYAVMSTKDDIHLKNHPAAMYPRDDKDYTIMGTDTSESQAYEYVNESQLDK